MTIQEFIKHFNNVKQTGENQFMALCPAHSDKKQSLSIGLSDNKKQILINCFAGCETDDILKGAGLKMADLFTETVNTKITKENTYSYYNAEGTLMYRKIRKDYDDKSKKFYFEQPNGKKGVQGIQRMVYNLPSVVQSSKVYFVEGEKCADAIIKNGRVATTLDNGANSKWLPEYSKYFENKEVIIIPDNDKAGFKYATNIATNLQYAKIIKLPDLSEKGDIYDWLEEGHTMNELDKLPKLNLEEYISEVSGGQASTKNTTTIRVETQPETMLRLIDEKDSIFFHDTENIPYAAVTVNGHKEVMNIESKDFSIWLNGLFYKEEHKPPKKESVSQVISVLTAKALFDNEEAIKLSNRVAKTEGAFWYSLGNNDWQAVKTTANGWKIEDNPPILFNRYKHQNAQVKPSDNGDINKILKYINIKEYHTLFLCWLVCCFVPEIPHAMPIFCGEKGAAKSTSCALLKKIIDPSALETLTIQKNSRSMAINLQQHWFLPFDNVSNINAEISDTLCRAITGGGIQQRKLFTDADDYIFTFKRCIAINGINNVVTRSDLLDRAILIKLQRISEKNRKEISEIEQEFKKDLPSILGGVFDTLSKAMKIYPDVKLDKLPRMADFARWGYAVGEALGGKGQLFLSEYNVNRNSINEEFINDNLVASLIVAFMKERPDWSGLVSELYNQITIIAPKYGINPKSKDFPPKPNVFSRRLNGIKSNLKNVGISFDIDPKTKGSVITITNNKAKISSLPPYRQVDSDSPVSEYGDDNDDIK
jgi:5S rRNA maturation endonuclease (ribonuclease M5)